MLDILISEDSEIESCTSRQIAPMRLQRRRTAIRGLRDGWRTVRQSWVVGEVVVRNMEVEARPFAPLAPPPSVLASL